MFRLVVGESDPFPGRPRAGRSRADLRAWRLETDAIAARNPRLPGAETALPRRLGGGRYCLAGRLERVQKSEFDPSLTVFFQDRSGIGPPCRTQNHS